jgi:DNA polymerase I-like protein with 3'-5' exonuclease and polymerase domains
MIKIDINFPDQSGQSAFVLKQSVDSEKDLLIVYDLYNFLSNKNVLKKQFLKESIIDIYLLESILFLGKYHKKNFSKKEYKVPQYGLRKIINEMDIKTNEITDYRENWIVDYAKKLQNQAVEYNVYDYYINIEIEFVLSLFELTKQGISVDSDKINKTKEKLQNAKQKLYFSLEKNNVPGIDLNALNDWAKGYGFYEYFPRTDSEIYFNDLPLLEEKHQVFKIFKRLNKLNRVGNFLSKLTQDSKIYPEYKTIGTVTGRCTAKNPNVMGIPKIFRPIIIPSKKGLGIVECDYAQMEVGVIAALSNDRKLIEDFNTGDVYSSVGSWLFGKTEKSYRPKAKILFLGILYGMSKKMISKHLDITISKVDSIFKKFFNKYSAVAIYLSQLEIDGGKNGYAQNIFGLKRYRYERNIQPSYWEKNWFKNFPVQSTAAVIFKKAIISIKKHLQNQQFNLLVPLYDSIVFEGPINKIENITNQVVDYMIKSMKDVFPVLEPKISVNKNNTSCWNDNGKVNSIEKFLSDPLHDIDIYEHKIGNVDWTKYL